jgi:hypothetical protein
VRGVIRREPGLELPDLAPGVTEVTITHAGRTFVTHTRKPWTEVMEDCAKRFSTNTPIGGPAVPTKVALPLPKRQAKPVPRAMPYKDDE